MAQNKDLSSDNILVAVLSVALVAVIAFSATYFSLVQSQRNMQVELHQMELRLQEQILNLRRSQNVSYSTSDAPKSDSLVRTFVTIAK